MHAGTHKNLYPIVSRYGNICSPAQERFLFILTISILILTMLPLRAFSQDDVDRGDVDCHVGGDIPFSLTKSATEAIVVEVGGPWFRTSGCLLFPKELVGCTSFYAANTTPSSPFGLWEVAAVLPGFLCTAKGRPFKRFCLNKPAFTIGSAVNITIRRFESGEIEVSGKNVTIPPDQLHPNCGWGVLSYLGDQRPSDTRDTDDFLFNGVAGEAITIKLEADHQSGNTGGIASLGLRGGSLNESVEGVLPLQIVATLPSSGKYSVIVAQPPTIPRGERYEGKYYLNVESLTSNVGPLEPDENVER